MPAKHLINSETKLITTVWEGVATDLEFIESLKKYQKDIKSKIEYIGYNEVVDLSKVTEMKITMSGLLTIGRIASKADNKHSNKKMALVVNSDFAFSFARLYIFYRNMGDNTRKKINIFKKVEEANKWIQENT